MHLYRFSRNFIQNISLVFTGILVISAFLFTCYAQDMTTQEVLTRVDNPIISLLGTGILLFLTLCISRLLATKSDKWEKGLLIFVLGFILIVGNLLVLFGRTAPAADAWSVYSAAEALASGDTSVIHPTASYLSYYPQQIGLLAFFELCIRGWNLLHINLEAYHSIKCLYVVLLCVIVLYQYKTVKLLWNNRTANCTYLMLAGLNFPLILYSSFVYGEIPSFCAMSVGFYYLTSLLQSRGKTRTNILWSLLGFTLAVLLRKNSLILIIAVLLVILLEAIYRRNKQLLLYGALCLLLTLTILPITQKAYELRAGNTLKTGVPAMSYFAMGMQESSRGNGWYNGFNFNTYQENEMDTAATNLVSQNYIKERTAYFKAHPDYAAAFYFNKYLSQWADGTYASRQATLATLGERHPLVQELYDGKLSPYFINFCNLYQNVLYIACFLFFLTILWKKQDAPLYLYLGMIGVFGGFLFHMIWEANARYIFLYSLLLIPYAARGLSILSNTSDPD